MRKLKRTQDESQGFHQISFKDQTLTLWLKSKLCVCVFGVFMSVIYVYKDNTNLLETTSAHLFTFGFRDAENGLTATQTTFKWKIETTTEMKFSASHMKPNYAFTVNV